MYLITLILTIAYYSFFKSASSFSVSQCFLNRSKFCFCCFTPSWFIRCKTLNMFDIYVGSSFLKMSTTNSAVVSLSLNVKSIADSTNFYTNVLGMKAVESPTEHVCKLSVGTSSTSKDTTNNYPTIKLSTLSTKYQIGDVSLICPFIQNVALHGTSTNKSLNCVVDSCCAGISRVECETRRCVEIIRKSVTTRRCGESTYGREFIRRQSTTR